MELYKKIVTGIVILSTLSALTGCSSKKKESQQTNNPKIGYSATIPAWYEGIALTSGDFDGDGDLDVIAASTINNEGPLYLLKNDGNGNFKH
jgi:hypothetical protein